MTFKRTSLALAMTCGALMLLSTPATATIDTTSGKTNSEQQIAQKAIIDTQAQPLLLAGNGYGKGKGYGKNSSEKGRGQGGKGKGMGPGKGQGLQNPENCPNYKTPVKK